MLSSEINYPQRLIIFRDYDGDQAVGREHDYLMLLTLTFKLLTQTGSELAAPFGTPIHWLYEHTVPSLHPRPKFEII